MRLRKQLFNIILVALGFLAFDCSLYYLVTRRYIDHSSSQMKAKSIEVDQYLPFDDNSKIGCVESSMNLSGDLPVLDGAAALFPVFSAVVDATYPETAVSYDGTDFTSKSKLQYHNTRGAYKAVVDGDADIIFCAKPSAEQSEYAKQNGVELELVPIGYEAFVFLVNKSNPVDSLTLEQVKKIYAGEYKRWSEVGGDKRYIDALQRNEGSGSQTAMEAFMGDTKMQKHPVLLDASAIGFSFRFYVEEIVKNGDVKMLALEGIYPSRENIQNETYPIIGNLYAVYDKANPNKNIQVLLDWLLSEEGQELIEKNGYIPLNAEPEEDGTGGSGLPAGSPMYPETEDEEEFEQPDEPSITQEIGGNAMNELDELMGFDKLGLYYEVHVEDLDGECFTYSVYFDNEVSDDKMQEVDQAIKAFVTPYDEKDIYLGYIDVSKKDEKAFIYLDVGNVEPEDSDTAVQGILKALDTVKGIKLVLVNER